MTGTGGAPRRAQGGRAAGGRLAAAAAVLFSFAGCMVADVGHVPPDGRRNVTPGPQAARFLPGAGEEDEFVGVISSPTPQTEPVESAERVGRYGLRLGYLTTAAADESGWSPSVCAGVYYRRAGPAARRVDLELGLDYLSLEREDGAVSTTLYSWRAEALFGSWRPEDGKTSFYVLGGAEIISEHARREVSGADDTNFQPGINLGLGVGSPRGAWDLRAVYTMFPSSPNVKGNFLVTAGVSF